MEPTIGRIIHYNLTDEDKAHLQNYGEHKQSNNNADVLPGVVVAVWNAETGLINAQVFVDGQTGLIWKTSITKGDGPGQWNWPVIQK